MKKTFEYKYNIGDKVWYISWRGGHSVDNGKITEIYCSKRKVKIWYSKEDKEKQEQFSVWYNLRFSGDSIPEKWIFTDKREATKTCDNIIRTEHRTEDDIRYRSAQRDIKMYEKRYNIKKLKK